MSQNRSFIATDTNSFNSCKQLDEIYITYQKIKTQKCPTGRIKLLKQPLNKRYPLGNNLSQVPCTLKLQNTLKYDTGVSTSNGTISFKATIGLRCLNIYWANN